MTTPRPSPRPPALLQRAPDRDRTSTARLLREALGLTMGDAARALGCKVSEVSAIEFGSAWGPFELRTLALAALEKRPLSDREAARALLSSPAALAQLVGGSGDAARGARLVLGHVARGTLPSIAGAGALDVVRGDPGEHHHHQVEPQPCPLRALDGADDAAPIVAGEG